MKKSQKFTLLLVGGLIVLGIVCYFILKEVRDIMKERAKQEMAAQGFREVKEMIGRFQRPANQ